MGVLLFLGTIGLEGSGIWISYWFGSVVIPAWLRYMQWSFLFPHTPIPAHTIGLIFVGINLGGHLLFVGRALFERWRKLFPFGRLSKRQFEAVSRVCDQIKAAANLAGQEVHFPPQRQMRYRLGPDLRAEFMGSALVIDDTLLKSPYLPPMLTHALGHYNGSDVLFRSMLDFLPPVRWCICTFGGLPFGLGSSAFFLLWLAYWYGREYRADRFVVMAGQAPLLIEALETIEQPREVASTRVVRTMPDAEHRIDRLLSELELQQPQANAVAGGDA